MAFEFNYKTKKEQEKLQEREQEEELNYSSISYKLLSNLKEFDNSPELIIDLIKALDSCEFYMQDHKEFYGYAYNEFYCMQGYFPEPDAIPELCYIDKTNFSMDNYHLLIRRIKQESMREALIRKLKNKVDLAVEDFDDISEYIQTFTGKIKKESVDLSNFFKTELCTNGKKLEFLVEEDDDSENKRQGRKGFLVRGNYSVLFGVPSVGKTDLILDLVSKLATNKPIFNKASAKQPIKTIILQADTEEQGMHYKRQCYNLADNENIRFFFKEEVESDMFDNGNYNFNLSLDNMESFEWLIKELDKNPCDLIILDTLEAWVNGVDLNRMETVSPLMKKFKSIARKFNCHVMLLHHNRKLGNGYKRSYISLADVSGSKYITGHAGEVFALDNLLDTNGKKVGNKRVFIDQKARYKRIFDQFVFYTEEVEEEGKIFDLIKFEYDLNICNIQPEKVEDELNDSKDKVYPPPLKSTINNVIKMMILDGVENFSKQELFDLASKRNPEIKIKYVEKVIKEKLDENQIEKVGSGKNTSYRFTSDFEIDEEIPVSNAENAESELDLD